MFAISRIAAFVLIASSSMLADGLRINKARRASMEHAHQKVDMSTYEGLRRANLMSKEKATVYFDLIGCLTTYSPYIRYMAYTAASFCRVYTYSCNNLWAEDLNREVMEGSYCIINWFEQSNSAETVTMAEEAYVKVLKSTLIPWYKTFMDLYALAPAKASTSFLGLDTHGYAAQHCELPMMSEMSKVQCLVETMRSTLSEVGDKKIDVSKLTSDETLRLLQRAQEFDTFLRSVEETLRMTQEHLSSFKAGPGKDVGIPGPIDTALGKKYYLNSFPMIGPISPFNRFPWDAVQYTTAMFASLPLTDMDPLAVCNDGSPALMYLGNFTSTTKWHLHLDGGFFCYDTFTCLARAKMSTMLVSTKGWESHKGMSGIFDPHMGGFPDYTHASLGYCSSDAWMGQVEVEEFTMVGGTKLSTGATGTYFMGYKIIRAAILKFLKMGMASTPGQEFFISGCSAGALAITAMADAWPAILADVAASAGLKIYTPKIWLLLDGAPLFSPPLKAGNPQMPLSGKAAALVKLLYENKTVTPDEFLNKGCVAANAANPGLCVFPPENILPHIKTKNVVVGMFWDNFITAQLEGFMVPSKPKDYKWGLMTVKMARDVMKKVTPDGNFWYSGCGDHCISDNPHFWRLYPATAKGEYALMTAKDVALMTKEGNTGHVVADECDDYNCGCIGQGHANTVMAAQALALAAFYNTTGTAIPFSSSASTGLAAGQVFGMQQITGP